MFKVKRISVQSQRSHHVQTSFDQRGEKQLIEMLKLQVKYLIYEIYGNV